MVVAIGQISLIIAFIVTFYSSLAGFFSGKIKNNNLFDSGKLAFYSVIPLLLISTASLIYSFVVNDFSVKYVAENSNLAMPSAYSWVAFYSGNSGSLLYIAMAFSIMGAISLKVIASKPFDSSKYFLGIISLTLLFFLFVIVFLANPLEKLDFVPSDGQGINPLLIHFGMFIHPPFQMLGLISVAIPFAIGVSVLLAGEGGKDEWVDLGRRWGMISWLILTVGLLLGSWWAYTILGWGGYWAWDPVENSALMPWLAMSAFIHSIMVQKRRGMFRMWNILLIIIAFTMAQLGMFINRGGPVPSVHSFAESTMGWIFLAIMGVTLFASLVIFIVKFETLKSNETLESFFSREAAFLAQNLLFLLIAFVTLWGTVFPIFSETFDETTMTVGQPFFNKVNGPLILLLVFLMGIGPFLPWRKASWKTTVRMLRIPISIALISLPFLIFLLEIQKIWALASFVILISATAGIFQEWVRGTISRHKKGEKWFLAFYNLINANRPRYGGYIVHLSVVMLGVGIAASSFYSVQNDFVMKPGDTRTIEDYSFTYIEKEETIYSDRKEQIAKFSVKHKNNDLGYLYPERSYYPVFRISATKGAINTSIVEDFYLVPSEFMEDEQAVFRVLINPMIVWMWLAGPVLIFGTIFALIPARSRKTKVPLSDVLENKVLES